MDDSSTQVRFGPDIYTEPSVHLRIGVTGHRQLRNRELICSKVSEVISVFEGWFEGQTPSIEVLSSLADGTDRLVAQCVLDRCNQSANSKGGVAASPVIVHLRAILPMKEDVYSKTFLSVKEAGVENQNLSADDSSVTEFYTLLKRATSVIVAPLPDSSIATDPAEVYKSSQNRHQAYQWAGTYIVNHCDILIVVWDGKKQDRIGSTWQIYQYARKHGRSLVVIDAETGKPTWSLSGDDLAAQHFYFQQYQTELSKIPTDPTEIDQRYDQLVQMAVDAGLSTVGLPNLRRVVLPRFFQARKLAMRYQNLHYRCGWIGYSCSALAVCTAAILSLWRPEASHVWYLVEALFIVITALCAWLLKRSGWQRKWIDCRFLVERLRATCFLYIAGIAFQPAPAYPDTEFHWLPDGWVTLALRRVWSDLPPMDGDAVRFRDDSQIRALGAFIFQAWVNHQQSYYSRASEENKKMGEIYERISLALLAATFVISLMYGTSESASRAFGEVPHVMAVTLPAITAALAGIQIFRHYARNAERYASMSHFLWGLGIRTLGAAGLSGDADQSPNLHDLRRLIQVADRAMAHEHEGWRTVFGVRLPGPG